MAISCKMVMWVMVNLGVISMLMSVEGKSPMAAPVGAPGPAMASTDCTTLLYNMTDCLTYVSKGSKSSKPDKACCPELAGMLDSNPVCLCQLLATNNKDLPISLDFSRALKLPKLCGLQTPPLSLCSAVGIPVGAPISTSSEGPSPSGTMAGMPTSSAGPSPLAGEPSPGKNGASNASINQLVYLMAGLAVAFTSLNL